MLCEVCWNWGREASSSLDHHPNCPTVCTIGWIRKPDDVVEVRNFTCEYKPEEVKPDAVTG